MAIRTITWTVGTDLRVSPTSQQQAGVQGDDNVTLVEFSLPAVLRSGYTLYMELISSCGTYDKTEALTVSDGKVSFLLPQAWTQDGGRAVIRLAATRTDADGAETETAYTFEGKIVFHERQTAFGKVQSLITGAIHQLTEWAKKAVEVSAASAQKMQETADNFEQDLSGTVADSCYRVIEKNRQTGMGLWIGTKEEYDALPQKPNNTMVFFHDDATMEEIQAAVAENTEAIAANGAAIDENSDAVKKLRADMGAAVPFQLAWEACSADNNNADFMALVGKYCTAGKHAFVIIQTTGTSTNLGGVNQYGLAYLITNGDNRHRISFLAGAASMGKEGFNNADTYSADAWMWYKRTMEAL